MLISVTMRIMAGVNIPFLSRAQVEEHSDLREVIGRIASSLRFHRRSVWRRCDTSWQRRVRTMNFVNLRRELRFLLSQSGFRRIARFYARIFRNIRSAVLIAGEFITEIGMDNTRWHRFNKMREM